MYFITFPFPLFNPLYMKEFSSHHYIYIGIYYKKDQLFIEGGTIQMYPHWNPNINQSQLAKLISLIEENNQLIKSMEQQQNQVCAPAGGSVIVRM